MVGFFDVSFYRWIIEIKYINVSKYSIQYYAVIQS